MTTSLTDFQKRLCNRLQRGLPLVSQPFAEIAGDLGRTESEVLDQTRQLEAAGVLRRICAVLNQRALGMASTLATAHVPDEQVPTVTTAVNALSGVSHNYLRKHEFNMWFTLQAKSVEQLHLNLIELQARFDIEFHSLPVTRVFKLDVRFDAESDDDVLLRDVERVPGTEPVALREEQKQLLTGLRDGLEVTSRPFDAVRPATMAEPEMFALLAELIEAGVIRRIAGVLNHHKLGFTANVMFVGQVGPEHIVEAGRWLAHSGTVSHCYERQIPMSIGKGWPYNLFAMMHGRTMAQIQHTIDRFTETFSIRSFELLPTLAELKKQRVRHSFV
jgi:DNA-binding Lrp family transcriptional regulator